MSDAASHITPESAVTGLTSTPATPPVQPDLPPQSAAQVRWRLRLWPALVLVALEFCALILPSALAPGTFSQFLGMFWGPILGAVGLAVWWIFASRLRWADAGLVLMFAVVGGLVAFLLSHETFGGFGMVIVGIPLATAAWALWLLVTSMLPWPTRRVGLLVVFLLAWVVCDSLRLDGVYGNFAMQLSFRWSRTEEDRRVAEWQAPDNPTARQEVPVDPADWPCFRGPNRDGRRPGVTIRTDWDENPPRLLWRERIGPGWSSFAVVGDRLYTQEQLGKDEIVVCYRASTGKPIWAHTDRTRFTEKASGAGPRATPTVHNSRVYALGANGQLNCLDAARGKLVWSRNIADDSGAKVPTWGFASSPLVVRGVVVVFAGGPDGKSVLGYDAAKGGEPLWAAGAGTHSYCSPQLNRIHGVEQVLMATEQGLMALAPTTGRVLWNHAWASEGGLPRCIQPALLSKSDILLGTGFGGGTRRLSIKRDKKEWKAEELWTTRAISPYYNDLVVHKGHLYGFDGVFFTCVSLEQGERKWRVRGYGNGQVLLLPDQDLLLVLSEQGEAALVEATPERHNRLGRFEAIEGKTWNHPVVAHGKLFVRNADWMACYELR